MAGGEERCTQFVLDESSHRAATAQDEASYGDAGELLRFAGVGLDWTSRGRVAAFHDETFAERYGYDADDLLCRVSGASDVRITPGINFVDGAALPYIDQGDVRLCLEASSGVVTLQIGDFQGSNVLEVNGPGLTGIQAYYPYGTAAFGTSPASQHPMTTAGYAGKPGNALGAYDFGARWYWPALARWASPDPAGNVDGPDRYRFMAANPMSGTDPDGREFDGFASAAKASLGYARVRSWLRTARARGIEQAQAVLLHRESPEFGSHMIGGSINLRHELTEAQNQVVAARLMIESGDPATRRMAAHALGIGDPGFHTWSEIQAHLVTLYEDIHWELMDMQGEGQRRLVVADLQRPGLALVNVFDAGRHVFINYGGQHGSVPLRETLIHEASHLARPTHATHDIAYHKTIHTVAEWAASYQAPGALSVMDRFTEAGQAVAQVGIARYLRASQEDRRWQITVRNADTITYLAGQLEILRTKWNAESTPPPSPRPPPHVPRRG